MAQSVGRFHKGKQSKERPNLDIRTGDDVLVISGEGRGKTPRKVLGVLPKEGKVIVEGVNVMKDRQKPKGNTRASGINQEGIIEKPFPIDRSNVALIDPKTNKRTRISARRTADGKPERIAKSGETI